jgi:hypothetical protein
LQDYEYVENRKQTKGDRTCFGASQVERIIREGSVGALIRGLGEGNETQQFLKKGKEEVVRKARVQESLVCQNLKELAH